MPERQIPVNVRRPLPAPLRGSVRQVRLPDSERLLALTFDLCQTPDRPSGYASAVVDFLRRNHIRATFYASGIWMRTHPVRIQQLLADPLFEVGSHGWSHRNPSLQSEKQFTREVDLAQAQYELAWEELYSKAARAGLEEEMALVPRLPLTFRFPYGACSRDQFSQLGEVGLPAVQWSVVPGDPDPRRTPFLLAGAILGQARPGAIVVLHANGRGVGTAEALRLAIPRLREAGYSFVTVSEMLAEGQPVTAQSCY